MAETVRYPETPEHLVPVEPCFHASYLSAVRQLLDNLEALYPALYDALGAGYLHAETRAAIAGERGE